MLQSAGHPAQSDLLKRAGSLRVAAHKECDVLSASGWRAQEAHAGRLRVDARHALQSTQGSNARLAYPSTPPRAAPAAGACHAWHLVWPACASERCGASIATMPPGHWPIKGSPGTPLLQASAAHPGQARLPLRCKHAIHDARPAHHGHPVGHRQHPCLADHRRRHHACAAQP